MREKVGQWAVWTQRTQVQTTRQALLLLGFLLMQAAFVAYVFGAWRFAEDLGFASSFIIASGPFSHWQVWALLGGALQAASSCCNRLGK